MKFYDALNAPLTGFMRCEVTAVKLKVQCYGGLEGKNAQSALAIVPSLPHSAKLWFSGTIKQGTLNIQRPFSSITERCVRQDSPCKRLNTQTAEVLKWFSMSLSKTVFDAWIK